MEIKTAESAGFCFGVERAVDAVYAETERAEHIFTYGPIIHNDTVVGDLKQRGVEVIDPDKEMPEYIPGTVVIRSHGVSREIQEKLEKRSDHCVDATCPFVKRIHRIVAEESAKGSAIVIIGNAGHPEVEGIVGWCSGTPTVIGSEEEARNYRVPSDSSVCVVSQTTYNLEKFKELVAILQLNRYNVNVVNTICNATRVRQEEASEIAAEADIMIVIGDCKSSNSAKLYEICRQKCPRTMFIQQCSDLNLQLNGSEKMIGITAGASTPKIIIEEVQNYVRSRKF